MTGMQTSLLLERAGQGEGLLVTAGQRVWVNLYGHTSPASWRWPIRTSLLVMTTRTAKSHRSGSGGTVMLQRLLRTPDVEVQVGVDCLEPLAAMLALAIVIGVLLGLQPRPVTGCG